MKRLIEITMLILQGFTFKTAKEYLFYREKYKDREKGQYSIKEIMSILPFNSKFDKLFEDLLSMRMALAEFEAYLPEYYCIHLKRDGSKFFCPLQDGNVYDDSHAIVELLREKKQLDVRKSRSRFGFNDKSYLCRFIDGNFSVNDQKISEEELLQFLDDLSDDYLVLEHIDGKKEEVTTINEDGQGPHIAYTSGQISHDVRNLVLSVAQAFPEVEYMHFNVACSDGKTVILNIDTGTDLVARTCFNEDISSFLDRKIKFKKRNKAGIFNTVKRYSFSYIAGKKGFVDYMYKNWLRGKKEDTKGRLVSRKERRWAHKRGFYSYRIDQYGLTEDNYKDFLSDYDYKRLRPINNEYRKWLWDKLSLYYILKKYDHYLPEYYFHITPKENRNLFFKMGGCPQEIESSAKGLIDLVKVKGKVVLKPVIASHGEGFYKFAFKQNRFYINDEEVDQEQMERILTQINVDYLVTQYVDMHKELKRIYPHVACTIRAMVINDRGYNPQIEDTYFRIGTRKTGQTDNLSSGGIFVHINEETGEFAGARVIENHKIKPCPYHPDTEEKIEGKIPFWQEICSGILQISRYISPLEYMGFDIIVTDSGFKILEINTHQDLHRYPEYNDRIKAYFKKKCEMKEKMQ